jgi:type I restriction enzyme R subunit
MMPPDVFDLICHAAFGQLPLTRVERVNSVKNVTSLRNMGAQARKVLDTLLDKYSGEGMENMEDIKILNVNLFNDFGTPVGIVNLFDGKNSI